MTNTWHPTFSKRTTTEQDYILSGVGTWIDTTQRRCKDQDPDILNLNTSLSALSVRPTTNETPPQYLQRLDRQTSVQQDNLRIIQTTLSSSVPMTSSTRSTSRRSTHGSSSSTSDRRGSSTRHVVIHDHRREPEYVQLQRWRDEDAGIEPWSSAVAAVQPRRIVDTRERSYAMIRDGADVRDYRSGALEPRRRVS